MNKYELIREIDIKYNQLSEWGKQQVFDTFGRVDINDDTGNVAVDFKYSHKKQLREIYEFMITLDTQEYRDYKIDLILDDC